MRLAARGAVLLWVVAWLFASKALWAQDLDEDFYLPEQILEIELENEFALPEQEQTIGQDEEPAAQQPSTAPTQEDSPLILQADSLNGQVDGVTVMEGDAVLEQGLELKIEADTLQYDQSTQKATATGNVRIAKEEDTVFGETLDYNTESGVGLINETSYRLGRVNGHGEAKKVKLLGEGVVETRDVTYTTCDCDADDPDRAPAWQLRADRITFDRNRNVAYAKNMSLRFMDVPILGIPRMSFPTNDERKSGWLTPTYAVGNTNGFQWTQPYYWNIAPQYDATFYPAIYSKQGLNIGNEFRYLGKSYRGSLQLDVMPKDKLTGKKRWALRSSHSIRLPMPFDRISTFDSFTLNLSHSRVGDNEYWRDFPDSFWKRRSLPTQARLLLNYGNWVAEARTLKWYTQQTADSTVTEPYDRLPELKLDYKRQQGVGWDYELGGQLVRFEGNEIQQKKPDGERGRLYAQASYLFDRGLWKIKPALRVDHARYRLDAPYQSGGSKEVSRTVPIFSADASMHFERGESWLGDGYTQTLEPKAYYVYAPYENQDDIPVYESDLNDFNFASIYSNNAFNGFDRVSDNNSLTLGVESRFIDKASGKQDLKLQFAQRLRFEDRRVTLPGDEPEKEGWGDMLFGASTQISNNWSADGLVQYNSKRDKSDRTALNFSYHPDEYKVLNIGYRFKRNTLASDNDNREQWDTSWQWPVKDVLPFGGDESSRTGAKNWGRWYTVGRVNYSRKEKKVTNSLLGFEYDGQCWIGRIVMQRSQSGSGTVNKRVMAQLEFSGLSSVGTNPLGALKQNIERYQRVRQNPDPYRVRQ